jgi:hypothetical protein
MVIHNELYYMSLVDNNIWEPGVIGSENLWKQVNADGSDIVVEKEEEEAVQPEIAEFVSGTLYQMDDYVIFENAIYKSLIDNNSWSPADYPAGWEIVAE